MLSRNIEAQFNWSDPFLTRQSQIFLLAADLKSFSLAAEQLKISQPSVSQLMKLFEEKVGCELFERTTRPLRLTSEGSVLFEVLKKQNSEMRHVLGRIRSENFIKPSFRIGIIESIANFSSAELTVALKPLFGQLVIHVAASEPLIQQLTRRELDAVVVSSESFATESFCSEPIFSSPLVIMIPAKIDLRKADGWESLQHIGIPFIHHSKNTGDGIAMTRLLEKTSVHFPNKLEVDNSHVIYQLISAGLGWSFFQPWGLFQNETLDSVKIIQTSLLPRRKIHLLSDKNIDPIIRSTVKDTLTNLIRRKVETTLKPLAPWLCQEVKTY